MIIGRSEDEGLGPGDVGQCAGDAGIGHGIGVVHGEVGLTEIEKAGFGAEFAGDFEKIGKRNESRAIGSQAAADAEEFEAHGWGKLRVAYNELRVASCEL